MHWQCCHIFHNREVFLRRQALPSLLLSHPAEYLFRCGNLSLPRCHISQKLIVLLIGLGDDLAPLAFSEKKEVLCGFGIALFLICRRSVLACAPPRFQCNSGMCLTDDSKKCDGVADCDDGSDEFACGKCGFLRGKFWLGRFCVVFWSLLNTSCCLGCGGGQFTCANGMCIPNHTVCNGYDDCQDNSDEIDCKG